MAAFFASPHDSNNKKIRKSAWITLGLGVFSLMAVILAYSAWNQITGMHPDLQDAYPIFRYSFLMLLIFHLSVFLMIFYLLKPGKNKQQR